MVEVKVLVEGYVRKEGDVELATCTTSLIKSNGLNIIVDPGMNRLLLLESLKNEGLSCGDINYVIITHGHLDHCLLAGIFENAKVIDDDSVYSFNGEIRVHEGKVPGTDIGIIETPGHDQFHCAVVVNTEDLGNVVIAADVFWWADNEEQKTDNASLMDHKDIYVKDEGQLNESRKKILEIADHIIPGHGKMFKVEK
jgi:glyoxylase-like metal-dependent hydrolase (beta-lactamase superfamily II)